MIEKLPTEGEWKWHWRSEGGLATGSVFAEPRPGHAYAVAICPRYQKREQWEIDAPMLAASKEMLAELKRLLEIHGYQSTADVIAKAEGR